MKNGANCLKLFCHEQAIRCEGAAAVEGANQSPADAASGSPPPTTSVVSASSGPNGGQGTTSNECSPFADGMGVSKNVEFQQNRVAVTPKESSAAFESFQRRSMDIPGQGCIEAREEQPSAGSKTTIADGSFVDEISLSYFEPYGEAVVSSAAHTYLFHSFVFRAFEFSMKKGWLHI